MRSAASTETATGSARPSGRARIETIANGRQRSAHQMVAPVLRGGRGLKRVYQSRIWRNDEGSARPSGRARIETAHDHGNDSMLRGSARPSGRARIETVILLAGCATNGGVAPVLRGGRGLKPIPIPAIRLISRVAPAPRGGRGLKQQLTSNSTGLVSSHP